MADKTLHPNMRALSALLDRERQALLSGDLNVLTNLTAEKEVLLKKLGSLASGSSQLANLRKKVERNQVLLAGAIEGIRDVSERIKLLRKAQRSLETYDRLGQRAMVTTDLGRKMEKRA